MFTAPKLTPHVVLAAIAAAVTVSVAPSAVAQPQEQAAHNQTPRLLAAQEVYAGNDVACPLVTPSPPPLPSPLVTAGGCRLHFSGPSVTLSAHLSAGGTEVLVSTCDIEFDLRLDSAGEGWISHQELTQGTAGSCTRRACGQLTPPTSEGRAWQIYLQETEVAGAGPRENGLIIFCTEALDGTNLVHCPTIIPFSQPVQHRYRFTAADVRSLGSFFPNCEHTGTFDSEATRGTTGEGQLEQNIEIRHA
ncbi:MAG TPA: hypothetical protein VEX36_11445 [Thermoleophilaceae bacterium]|nr:hypothetical protein [Thermoleophilaceae bacterium]